MIARGMRGHFWGEPERYNFRLRTLTILALLYIEYEDTETMCPKNPLPYLTEFGLQHLTLHDCKNVQCFDLEGV